MALNIKNREVEDLAAQVARMVGQTKTEAIRQALLEQRQRLAFRVGPLDKETRVLGFLEREVWPYLPQEQRGRRLTRREEYEILGYGSEGV